MRVTCDADQRLNRPGQLIGSDVDLIAFDVEEELREEASVEGLAVASVGLAVHLLRVAEQFDQMRERLASGVRLGVVGRLVELFSQSLAVLPDGPEPVGDLGLRPVGVADEIEKAIFECVELGELGLGPLAKFPAGR